MFDNKKILSVLLTSLLFLICSNIYSDTPTGKKFDLPSLIVQQVALDGNNINAWIMNTGIFDHNNYNIGPGFEWPKGTGQYAIFSAGLNIAAYVNNQLLMSCASFSGEYSLGYVSKVNGIPRYQTNSSFHIYKVKHGDNAYNNPDWLNWGLMVPYGAPFIDVDHNEVYDPFIDTPGVKSAEQTVFLCITDANPSTHNPGEGFGGGTAPMYNEVHLTAWCYITPGLQDVQFLKWDIINKNIHPWNKTYFSIFCDPDLGCPNDDCIGCDTTVGLGFCYNGEDMDCAYTYQYSPPIPAVGFLWLNCPGMQNQGLTSIDYCIDYGGNGPTCEQVPNPGIDKAYNFMKGVKSDGTPWVMPPGGNANLVTKFVYTGDPETGQGWCECSGSIWNCGGPGHYSGELHCNTCNKNLILNSGSDNLTVNPGDTHKVMIAQLIERGSSRLNSLIELIMHANIVKSFACNGFEIGLKNESEQVSHTFIVFPNYPNPFNPTTKIRFQAPLSPPEGGMQMVSLVVYDLLGREITTLFSSPWGRIGGAIYEVEWDGTNYPSGVYFYKFTVGDYTKTQKMILLK